MKIYMFFFSTLCNLLSFQENINYSQRGFEYQQNYKEYIKTYTIQHNTNIDFFKFIYDFIVFFLLSKEPKRKHFLCEVKDNLISCEKQLKEVLKPIYVQQTPMFCEDEDEDEDDQITKENIHFFLKCAENIQIVADFLDINFFQQTNFNLRSVRNITKSVLNDNMFEELLNENKIFFKTKNFLEELKKLNKKMVLLIDKIEKGKELNTKANLSLVFTMEKIIKYIYISSKIERRTIN